MGRYVILVRHASRDFNSNHDESKQAMSRWDPCLERVVPCFEVKGLPRTLAIAHRLMGEMRQIKITRIWHSPHNVAAQTAQAYQYVGHARSQNVCSVEPLSSLDPDTGSVAEALRELKKSGLLDAGSAIILVGHQPMLTSLARDLTQGKLPAETLPLDGSEAACLEMHDGKGATLLWMLTEKSSDLMEDLKEKIRSKYDVAKFFLGAFVVNTGFVLSGEIWKVSNAFAMGLVFLGFVLTLVALALTAATLMSYDALLMPTNFWTGHLPSLGQTVKTRSKKWSVLRPPSQAQVVLFYEMVHVWKTFFIPSLICAFAAIAIFLVALVYNSLSSSTGRENAGDVGVLHLIVIAVVAVGALTLPLVLHYRPNKPDLGFED